MRREQGIYRVLMDQRWALEDLYAFPHTYSQIYSFIYCFDSELDAHDSDHSYLNIYKVLSSQVPHEHRPTVARIQYASPGFMDIFLNPDVALQVAKSAGIFFGMGVTAVETYKRIYKAILSIRAAKKKHDVEIITYSAEEIKAFGEMSNELAKQLGFKNVAKLDKRTKNAEVTLKLLMAHYRPLDILNEFVREGKVTLPENIEEKTNKGRRLD